MISGPFPTPAASTRSPNWPRGGLPFDRAFSTISKSARRHGQITSPALAGGSVVDWLSDDGSKPDLETIGISGPFCWDRRAVTAVYPLDFARHH